MPETDSIQYTSVPRSQSWLIPFWDPSDVDEYEDLVYPVRSRGPERFHDAIGAFNSAVSHSDAVGVRLYVGTQLPKRVTLKLAPDSQTQAIDLLDAATAHPGGERGVVPWPQIWSQLRAIRHVTTESDDGAYPSFGFSAIVPLGDGYREASTDWIAKHSERPRFEE